MQVATPASPTRKLLAGEEPAVTPHKLQEGGAAADAASPAAAQHSGPPTDPAEFWLQSYAPCECSLLSCLAQHPVWRKHITTAALWWLTDPQRSKICRRGAHPHDAHSIWRLVICSETSTPCHIMSHAQCTYTWVVLMPTIASKHGA